MDQYNHKDIENKWQKRWADEGIYKTPNKVKGKENNYIVVELPYPSGNLHVGHWYAYAVPDIFARYQRMKGYNVLYPMGFDSFGLPAENAAIISGINPREFTDNNIKTMKSQLSAMGNSFDWDREISTCDPEYYKWNQFIFNKFFEKDLVYKKKVPVNWDPVDQTVLANEQVLPDGTAERSGAKVEKKDLEQWMFKITDYAERLLKNLDNLDWPESIKALQRNWIGKSEGANIDFEVSGTDKKIKVFTTRPDTLFGATYMVLAPEHDLIKELSNQIENIKEVEKYIEKAKNTSEIDRLSEGKEKTGVELKGIKAINPANKEEIPIFIADYVLNTYGTGAIMAVPAHDERDYEFAKKFNIPIRCVVNPIEAYIAKLGDNLSDAKKKTEKAVQDVLNGNIPYKFSGDLINSGKFDGLSCEEAKKKITDFVGGEMTTTYKMRDWSISRQRYWGTPIPIVYDPEGNAHAIPEEHLPWLLPTDVDYKPKGTSPLGSSKELLERTEKIFGKGWKPEIDTMDTFMDSSWYFLRYLDPKNDKEFSSKDIQKDWMPISTYFGGAEHTTVHLLYSRFFQMALYDLGLATVEEPYERRFNRGLILNEDGSKMSKRKGALNPDEQVSFVGSDAVKMYLAFMGPYGVTENYPWNSGGVVGIRKFLEKVWKLSESLEGNNIEDLEVELNQTIKKVSEDIDGLKFNTAISAMMILINSAQDKKIGKEQFVTFLKILAPFAPHITEEIWHKLGNESSIHLEEWPKYDESKLESETQNIAIQINGKSRGVVEVKNGATENEVIEEAKKNPNIAKYMNFEAKKVIFVPGKILNLVG